jgi:transcriptional regulator with XRE-family HTH domain
MGGEGRLLAATELMILRRAFGVRLRELRHATRVSPSRLAQKCRVAPRTIKDAESGRGGEPGLALILVICQALNIPTDELLDALPVPDGPILAPLILAAIERAERVNQREEVLWADILEQLNLPSGTASTHRVRPPIEALIVAGAVWRGLRSGNKVWGLTPTGRKQHTGKTTHSRQRFGSERTRD